MELSVEPGKYVIAVSGGVDSVVLLDLLCQQPNLTLVVAHFDHGIRSDSTEDVELVRRLAEVRGLPFATERVELGPNVSEATAREARYRFLYTIQADQGAKAIITAHHQDDVIETALLNFLRGSGRRGLTSLKSNEQIVRPLLSVPKKDIIAYALKHKLSWREDTTNHDERYTRNYLRHRLLVNCDDYTRQQLLAALNKLQSVNAELDGELAQVLARQGAILDRRWLTSLPHTTACEVMAAWLRANQLNDYDRPTIERLVLQAKTRPAGKRLDVRRGAKIKLTNRTLALEPAER